MNRDGQRVIATVGLHGSASTWTFNVARELAIGTFGSEFVRSIYADDLARVTDEAQAATRRCLVLKSHHGSEELDTWLEQMNARLVLSVRDPRDAVLSMMLRFGSRLQQTVRWILADCARLARLSRRCHLMLRYEDRFFEDRDAVRRVADACDLSATPAAAQEIYERYETDKVRAFAGQLDELPAERVATAVGTRSWSYDLVTQIHGPHIGNTRSGKWRALPPSVQSEITRVFLPYLKALDYAE